MAELITFIIGIPYIFIFLMPVWIRGVSRSSLSVTTRCWIMLGMVIISIASTAHMVFRSLSLSLHSIVIGSVLGITYLFIVFITFFMSWPRSWPR
jgi:hypothetical protein